MKNGKKRALSAKSSGPRRHPILVLLALTAALLTGLYLPNLFAFFQDLRTDRLDESVNLGAETLSLTSSASRLERLKVIGSLYTEPLPVNDRSGLFLTEGEVLNKMDALLAMASAAGLETGSLTIADASAPEPYVYLTNMAGGTSLSTLTVWMVEASRQIQRDDGSYIYYSIGYLVDDTTGMLLLAGYEKSGIYGEFFSGGLPDCRTAVQTLAEHFLRSEGLTELSCSVEVPTEVNPYRTMCYIHFLQDRETLYSMPLVIGENYWGINTIRYYYDGHAEIYDG